MPGAWRVAASSVRGTRHVGAGLPCQDAHAWCVTPRGSLVAVVADGAGSAPLAEHGARVAADAALAHLRAADPDPAADGWEDALRGALHAARAAVEEGARAHGAAPRDLATTLIVILASEAAACAAQVGDGAALARTADGALHPLTAPVRGEYANETVFLSSPGGVEGAQLARVRGALVGIAALTDGLQGLALQGAAGAPHPPFFGPLFHFAAEPLPAAEAQAGLDAFLTGPRVTARTDDDLTLLLAVRER
ncbi:MAG: hypothetical protein AVDCRST_MAG68-4075 [uncultured Gemmatimonadetes bacterium]|uniref:PPM-type phosphatase domain-containing protein n=1 Tax=uncultured Gemmatimonadota bacterium TaxID=203437 RepID=A0A6J4MG87_9BACT|nr:MAG: hypothetical protein AVDCRST_MAG68-4075 [uncultured Gemmatimonadota bacterium]